MNNEYAAKLFSLLQVNIQKLFGSLCRQYQIENFQGVNYIYNKTSKLLNVYDLYENVYLYGTGIVGIGVLTQMKNFGIAPKAFIETECEAGKQVQNIPVYSIDSIKLSDNDMIIISVGYKLRNQIKQELENRKIDHYVFCQDLQ